MRDTWYGDRRDLVKWGTLAHIAQREKLGLIVQVPYLRCDNRLPLTTSNGRVNIHSAVWSFFRNVPSVVGLGAHLDREILVIDDPYDSKQRDAYCQKIVDRLRSLTKPKVVLLDPDTGLAPTTAKAEHVTPPEVQAVWRALREGDWLVLYQHAWRSKSWQADSQQKFSQTCGVEDCEKFIAPDIARDVAFFATKKMNGNE